MNLELNKLLDLQSIDLQLIELDHALSQFPKQKAELESKAVLAREQYREFDENHKKKLVFQKNLELDIEKIKEQIHKLNMSLNAVKKNEEYTRILADVEKQKSQIREIEEKTITMMESIETDQAALKMKKDEMEQAVKDIELHIKQLEMEQSDNCALKQSRTQERHALVAELQGELFSRYQKYFEKKKTIILVPLDAHDHCGGCHQLVTVYLKNEIRKKGLESCDQCGRLIYMPVLETGDEILDSK